MHLHILLFYTLLVGAAGAAWRMGGTPEPPAAAMLVAATVASKLVAWPLYGRFAQFEAALFVVDVLLLAGLLAVALTADRYWPLWLTPFHAYTVVAHLGRLASPDTFAAVYLSNSALMADPVMTGLIAGSWRHRRRSRNLRSVSTS